MDESLPELPKASGVYEVMAKPHQPWVASGRLLRVSFAIGEAPDDRKGLRGLLPAWSPRWECQLRYAGDTTSVVRVSREAFPADTADTALWHFVQAARESGLPLEDGLFADPVEDTASLDAAAQIGARGMQVYREALREEQRTGGLRRLIPFEDGEGPDGESGSSQARGRG